MPFAILFLYGVWFMIKNRNQVDAEYLMYCLGSGFTFMLSFFAGYTFFNSSTMMVIIVLNALLVNKIVAIKKATEKFYK